MDNKHSNNKNVKRKRFHIIRQPMDGNCFYHSVSYLLNYHKLYTNTTHISVRKFVLKFLNSQNKYKKEIESISTLTKWAEHEEVLATANAFNICIKVWEGLNNMWIKSHEMIYTRNDSAKIIFR